MRTLRILSAGPICLMVASALPLSAVAQGDGVTVVEDLVYASTSRADTRNELKLDLYVGPAREDAPMVVHVVGGDQGRGSATQLARALAEQGTTVLAVDGPGGSPEAAVAENAAGLRAIVETVACAVRFARGSDYGSETAPLVLSGYSYGGGAASHVALAGESFASLWEQYGESGGGPPSQVDCTVSEASTHVDGIVGIVGTYDIFLGQEGRFDGETWLQHAELQKLLQGTVGLHPELKVRLLVGDSDWLPYEVPAGFESVLVEAGYDVGVTKFAGGHIVPLDLTVETVMDLVVR